MTARTAEIFYMDGEFYVHVNSEGVNVCNDILTAATELTAIDEVMERFEIARKQIKVIPW